MAKKKDGRGHSPNSKKNIYPAPNPATANNMRAIRHGGFSERYISPMVEKKEKELKVLVGKEAQFIRPIDSIIIRNLARCLARLERFDLYLDQVGDVITSGKSAKLNPVISAYFTCVETARRHCESLGLSPSSRARLGVDIVRYRDIAARLGERAKKPQKKQG